MCALKRALELQEHTPIRSCNPFCGLRISDPYLTAMKGFDASNPPFGRLS